MAEDRKRWEGELDKFPDYKAQLAKKAAARTQQAAERNVKKRNAKPKPKSKQRVRVLPKATARPRPRRSIAPTETNKKLRKVWLLTAVNLARLCCCQLLTCEERQQADVDDPHPVSVQARKQAIWEEASDESEEESEEEEEEPDLGDSDSADELPSDADKDAGEPSS